MIKIILYIHCKLFKYKTWGSLKKIQYNTVTIKKMKKVNEKGCEETHVFANFSFFILLVFEF